MMIKTLRTAALGTALAALFAAPASALNPGIIAELERTAQTYEQIVLNSPATENPGRTRTTTTLTPDQMAEAHALAGALGIDVDGFELRQVSDKKPVSAEEFADLRVLASQLGFDPRVIDQHYAISEHADSNDRQMATDDGAALELFF